MVFPVAKFKLCSIAVAAINRSASFLGLPALWVVAQRSAARSKMASVNGKIAQCWRKVANCRNCRVAFLALNPRRIS